MLFKPIPVKNPEKFSFPRQCNALKMNGSWPLDENFNIFSFFYTFLSWYVVFSVGITIYFQSAFLVYTFGDIMATTENCCTTFMGAMNFIRIVHMRLCQTELKILINDFVTKIWIPSGTNPKVEKFCQRNMIIFGAQSAMMVALICMYCTLPLLELFLSPEGTERPFPYKMIFFYDAQHGIRYILTYIFTAMAGVAVVSTLFAEDSLFGFFVTHSCGQFKILRKEIEKAIPLGYESGLRKYGEQDLTESLVQKEYSQKMHVLIEKHNILLEFCKKMDKFFSPIMLVNFTVSSILICMVGFQLVTGKMFIGDFLKFVVYIISSFSQLFVLCWNGDALIQNSLEVTTSLYNCNWEGGNYYVDEQQQDEKQNESVMIAKTRPILYYPGGVTFNKKLAFMIMRAQKPCRITAMKFSVVSLQSFTAIISTSMSYFTLLQSLVEVE